MRSQPNRDYIAHTNDDIETPVELARRLVGHFKPSGRILEPCKGGGNFVQFMPGAAWCELKQGRDFYQWNEPVDWIITNPPWSQIRRFLAHSMRHANHVVFLLTVNHLWTTARVRDIRRAGFGTCEIVLLDMPKSFPKSGFQLGAVYLRRGWVGQITLTDWTCDTPEKQRKGGRANKIEASQSVLGPEFNVDLGSRDPVKRPKTTKIQ